MTVLWVNNNIPGEYNMKIIFVSHGSFSKGLYESVQMIFGEQKNMSYLGLYPTDDVEDFTNKLEEEIKKSNPEEDILILSDLFYGSPFNATVRLMAKYDLYHITGINLPLTLEVITQSNAGKTTQEICDSVIELSKEGIVDIRKQLGDALKQEEENI